MNNAVLLFGLLIIALLAIVVATLADLKRRRAFSDYPAELQTAAFRFIDVSAPQPSYLGGDVGQLPEIERTLLARRSAADRIKNAELRACVHAYLDYYQGQWLEKHRVELSNQTTRKRLDAYNARRKEGASKVEAILRAEGLPHQASDS